MKPKRICILGGTGFIGQHLVRRLNQEGHFVRILTRRRERHRNLLVLPNVEVNEADVFNLDDLEANLRDIDIVINLIGILSARGKGDHQFRRVHVEVPQNIIQTCRKTGTKRYIHLSALNADASTGKSYYLRTKGDAESFLQATRDMNITVFRPSVIFGQGDSFLNRFARLLRRSPFMMLLPCPNARVAPVYVGDVVEAIVQSLQNRYTYSERYELCGPKAYTMKEIVEYTSQLTGIKRTIIGLNRPLSALLAAIMEFVPGKPFTMDNYRSLQVDAVCDKPFPAIFNLVPTEMEKIVPLYMSPSDSRTRYHDYRIVAKRKER
jgi:NADH dehydrogenase